MVSGLLLVAACNSGAAPTATSHPLATLPAAPTIAVTTAPSATPTAIPTATPTAPPQSTPTPAASSTPTSAPPSGSPGTGISGDWSGTYQSTKVTASHGTFTVTFSQDGDTISGDIVVDSPCVGHGTINGTASGSTITFGVVKAAENIAFNGELNGDSLSGNYTTGPGCGNDKGTWSATRNT
jgi:hypothetical protein